MKNASTLLLMTCILWYAAASTGNPFALAVALIVSLTVLPYWAFLTAAKTGRKPVKWLLISIVLPFAGPLILALTAQKDISRVAREEKAAGRKGYFERRFGVWGGLIPYLAVLAAVLVLFAVSRSGRGDPLASTAMPYTGPVRYVDTTNGNTTTNLVHGAMMLGTGQYQLFTNLEDGGRIYAIPFGGQKQPYAKESGYNFCVWSDYIYYINRSDNGSIHRMDMQAGSPGEKILEDSVSQFCTAEKMLFYINKGDGDRIYRADMEGRGRVRLGNKPAANLFQLYGYLYYLNKADGNRIYRMTVEGKQNRKLGNDRAKEMIFSRNRLYYINLDDDGRIYSMDDNGKDRKKALDEKAGCIGEGPFAFYFSKLEDGGRIYKWKMDEAGPPVKLVEDTNCEGINVDANILMYVSNGKQTFVGTESGSLQMEYYPELAPKPEEPVTIDIPEPPQPADISSLQQRTGEMADVSQIPPPPGQTPVLPFDERANSSMTPEQQAEIFKTRQQFADYVFPDGRAYNGDRKDGLPDGKGTSVAANGDVYTGSWKAGKMDGYGNYQSGADGSMWMGEWKNDRKNGEGRYLKAGETIEGIWKDDEYVGPVGGN